MGNRDSVYILSLGLKRHHTFWLVLLGASDLCNEKNMGHVLYYTFSLGSSMNQENKSSEAF